MAASRCSVCAIDWPCAFHNGCAVCLGPTSYIGSADPIDVDQATSLKAHAEFDRWVEAETPQARTSRRAAYARERKRQADALAVLEQQLEADPAPES